MSLCTLDFEKCKPKIEKCFAVMTRSSNACGKTSLMFDPVLKNRSPSINTNHFVAFGLFNIFEQYGSSA